jgi:hypothetical protein
MQYSLIQTLFPPPFHRVENADNKNGVHVDIQIIEGYMTW